MDDSRLPPFGRIVLGNPSLRTDLSSIDDSYLSTQSKMNIGDESDVTINPEKLCDKIGKALNYQHLFERFTTNGEWNDEELQKIRVSLEKIDRVYHVWSGAVYSEFVGRMMYKAAPLFVEVLANCNNFKAMGSIFVSRNRYLFSENLKVLGNFDRRNTRNVVSNCRLTHPNFRCIIPYCSNLNMTVMAEALKHQSFFRQRTTLTEEKNWGYKENVVVDVELIDRLYYFHHLTYSSCSSTSELKLVARMDYKDERVYVEIIADMGRNGHGLMLLSKNFQSFLDSVSLSVDVKHRIWMEEQNKEEKMEIQREGKNEKRDISLVLDIKDSVEKKGRLS